MIENQEILSKEQQLIQMCAEKQINKKTNRNIKRLLKEQADINTKDDDGNTPLILGLQNNNIDLVNSLLEKNANVNIKNKEDKTALMYSVACLHDIEIIKQLIKNGAKKNLETKKTDFLYCALYEDRYDILTLFLEKRRKSFLCSYKKENTYLTFAAQVNAYRCISLLIRQRANVNTLDNQKRPPIVWAVIKKNVNSVKVLIEYKAYINGENEPILQPIILASIVGQKDIIKLLIEKKANIAIENRNKRPIAKAVEYKHLDIAKILLEHLINQKIEELIKQVKSENNIEFKCSFTLNIAEDSIKPC